MSRGKSSSKIIQALHVESKKIPSDIQFSFRTTANNLLLGELIQKYYFVRKHPSLTFG